MPLTLALFLLVYRGRSPQHISGSSLSLDFGYMEGRFVAGHAGAGSRQLARGNCQEWDTMGQVVTEWDVTSSLP